MNTTTPTFTYRIVIKISRREDLGEYVFWVLEEKSKDFFSACRLASKIREAGSTQYLLHRLQVLSVELIPPPAVARRHSVSQNDMRLRADRSGVSP